MIGDAPLGPRAIDLTGRTFGRLRINRFHGRSASGKPLWLCDCACGGSAVVLTSQLRTGGTCSCGCLFRERRAEYQDRASAAPRKDLTNQVFGRLRVQGPGARRRRWICACACGRSEPREYDEDNLLAGRSKSCGCSRNRVRRDVPTDPERHRRKPLPLVRAGEILGGAAVVAASWEHTHRLARLTIMAQCACGSPLQTVLTARSIEKRLDTIRSDWRCGKCRTRHGSAQARAKLYQVAGELITMAELAKRGGLSMEGMRARLKRGLVPVEAVRPQSRGRLVLFGLRVTAEDMGRIAGVPPSTILDRLYKQRKTAEEAIAMASNHHNRRKRVAPSTP